MVGRLSVLLFTGTSAYAKEVFASDSHAWKPLRKLYALLAQNLHTPAYPLHAHESPEAPYLHLLVADKWGQH